MLGLILISLFVAGPEARGWRYTHWGMSSAEVSLASRGEVLPMVERRENSRGLVEIEGRTLVEDSPFQVVFGFVRDELVSVRLTPFDSEICPRLHAALTSARGDPVSRQRIGADVLSRWPDDVSASVIVLREEGGDDYDCSVLYQPGP